MSSSEEILLDYLLPELQKGINVEELKPYLRMTCGLSDEECSQLTRETPDNSNAVQRLVRILKQKGPHCCARIMLYALRQSVDLSKSPAAVNSGHIEAMCKLEQELKSTGKLTETSEVQPSRDHEDNDSSPPDNMSSDVSFFPSAVPESPFSVLQFGTSTVVNDTAPRNPLSWHSHAQQTRQLQTSKQSQENSMAVIISVGPSKEPVPLMHYQFLNQNQLERDPSLDTALIKESKAIQKGFADFVVRVCNLLEASSTVDVEKIRLSLSYQSCHTSAPLSQVKVFSNSSTVAQAKTIPSLLIALNNCTSWFNYELISNIAKEFGGKEGERLVDGYESALRTFFKRLVFHCPPLMSNYQGETLEGFERMDMRVNWNLHSCTLQDVAIFKNTVCGLLRLNPSFLVLRSVGDQQFQLSWAIPAAVVHQVLTETSIQSERFMKERVESVRVANNFINFKNGSVRFTSSGPAGAHSNNLSQFVKTQAGSSSQHEVVSRDGKTSATDDIDTPFTPPLCDSPQYRLKYSTPVKTAHHVNHTGFETLPAVTTHRHKYAPTSIGSNKFWSPTSPGIVSVPRSADGLGTFILPIVSETGVMVTAANEAKRKRSRQKQSVHWEDGIAHSDQQTSSSSIESHSVTNGNIERRVRQVRHFHSDSTIPPQQQSTQSEQLSSTQSQSTTMLAEDYSVAHLPDQSSAQSLLTTKQHNYSAGLLWKILGRANLEIPANIYIASIQTTHSNGGSELQVRKGQQLKALYRVSDSVCVETQAGKRGFIPYACCRLSRKHYGPTSKLLYLSYAQFSHASSQPSSASHETHLNDTAIEMVAIQNHKALTSEELSVRCGDKLKVLYWDNSWVYAVNDHYQAGILPYKACQVTPVAQRVSQDSEPKKYFSKVTSVPPPKMLQQKTEPVKTTNDDNTLKGNSKDGSKVGKIVCIIQNFVPKANGTNDFTIRKGLRVKVLHENGQKLYVTTKSGASFWIPANYVRIARKYSDSEGFVVSGNVEATSMSLPSQHTTDPHSDVSMSTRSSSYSISPSQRGYRKTTLFSGPIVSKKTRSQSDL